MTSSPTPTVLPDARALYTPTEGDKLADRLLQSIAFKVYTSDDDAIREAAVMLRRLSTPPASDAAVPAGFVLVPVEPTEAMLEAAGLVDIEIYPTNIPSGLTATNSKEARAIWVEMLAAAPKVASELLAKPATEWRDPRPDRNCDYCGPGWKGAHKYKCPRAHEDNGEGGPVDD